MVSTTFSCAPLLDEGLYPLDDREPVTYAPDLPPGGVAITISGLAESFGSNTVLHGIDLQVPAGQFLTVIGKSGCGKSTLLRILAGLDRPSSGEVLFDGVPSDRSEHVARLMFQEPRLLPWARVIGNVEVGLGARRSLPDAERPGVDQAGRGVGLESARQRVAVRAVGRTEATAWRLPARWPAAPTSWRSTSH